MRYLAVLLLFLASFFVHIPDATAQWVHNGVVVSSTNGSAYAPAVVPDGAGGVIIAWQDSRNLSDNDVYAQRLDASGMPLWTAHGVPVSTAAGAQESVDAVSDGAGGVIIAWKDVRSGSEDIYVQRLDAAGVPQWAANGVALCTATDTQFLVELETDGAGGAIATWTDFRNGNWDVYARRVNAAGSPQWTADGVAVCTAAGSQLEPQLVSDGAGGAIITWDDTRAGSVVHVYAQRINSAGTPLWTANGALVSGNFEDQYNPRITTDGAGGAIIAWQDERITGTVADIFAARVDPFGMLPWGDGVEVTSFSQHQQGHAIVSDGAGGAIIAWESYVSGIEYDIYAQRIGSGGVPLWTYNGLPVCTVSGSQERIDIASDGGNGAVIVWEDHRAGINPDLYARALDGYGTSAWQFDGVPLCDANFDQQFPAIAADGNGGVVVAWSDQRAGPIDLYAQRAELRYGYWGRPEPTIASAADNPGDQGGSVLLRWRASQRDRFDLPGISHYSVWRSTDDARAGAAAAPVASTADPPPVAADFSGAALWVRATANGPEYWEWIANQDAFYQESYSIVAPTRQDEVAGVPAPHAFKILAHEYVGPQTRTWESAAVTASSLDNLAPPAPIQLAGERAGSGTVFLNWKAETSVADLKFYRVYRSGAEEVTPTAPYFLVTSDSPSYVDPSAPGGALHYVVTAEDVHGNESPPSNMVGVFDATDVGGDTPPVTALTVRPNRPNPFAGATELQIGLPADADVSVEIYDVVGRRVNAFELKGAGAGWKSVPFDGRDANGAPLASGVYFYRVTAAGRTVTNKMVIAR
ncbi:MAG TPA: T9SS type A sorting domain-containing protein [Candidatus Krumholzibacteria bacterium]|nr:T9SS type A sorting domain-containing protein [Candidatus Krumholzibacteria bacterium]